MLIKSCPFCGGKPFVEKAQRGYVNGESTHTCFVRCKQCNARSPRVDLKEYGKTAHSSEAIEYVVDMWNRRNTVTTIFDLNVRTTKVKGVNGNVYPEREDEQEKATGAGKEETECMGLQSYYES